MSVKRTALLVGATGLVGSHLLELLLGDEWYDKLIVLTRRRLMIEHPKFVHLEIDFDKIEAVSFGNVHDVFCCLGTTIKKAGSRQAFEKVDYEYPLTVAKAALAHGAQQFLIVSALGANPDSSMFYAKVKGKMELAIQRFPFQSTHIFRPSILLGDRQEFRPGERLGIIAMKLFSFAMVAAWRKHRPIDASTVAQAMVSAARAGHLGCHTYESDAIQQIDGRGT